MELIELPELERELRRVEALALADKLRMDRTRSNMALMKEYLRRVAVWREAIQNESRDFIGDLAGLIRPDLTLPGEVIARLTILPHTFTSRMILYGHLRWTLLAALKQVPAGGPGAPFEPLIVLMERGGSIRTEHGFIEVDSAMLPVAWKSWSEFALIPPLTDMTWPHLDEVDSARNRGG